MLLYKFKSLAKWGHVGDLLQSKRLYCPRNQGATGSMKMSGGYSATRLIFPVATASSALCLTIDEAKKTKLA